MRPVVSNQGGFSLVELLVATTISVIVLGGISTVLVTANKSNQINSDLKVLQDKARYALEQLSRDIRLSGYYGCVEDNNPTDAKGPIMNKAQVNPFSASPLTGADSPASDNLFIQYAAEITTLSEPTISPLDDLEVHDASNFSVDEIAIIGTCESADTFVVSEVDDDVVKHQSNSTSGNGLANDNASDSLFAIYPSGTALYRLNSISYAVAPDTTNDNLPTLFRNDGLANLPLIPGVDSFQAQYGIDTSNDGIPDSYVSASGVLNWNTVTSIRLGLLIRTEDQYGQDIDRNTDAYPISVLDQDFGDDGLPVRRRVYQTTIFVRNSI